MTQQEFFDNISNFRCLDSYINLSEQDKAFFNDLFMVLIKGPINWSNKKLSNFFRQPESTIEKRLKRLDKAKMIYRECSRYKDQFGEWKVADRIIKLHPKYFDFNYDAFTHKIYIDYLLYKEMPDTLKKLLNMDHEEFKEFAKKITSVKGD